MLIHVFKQRLLQDYRKGPALKFYKMLIEKVFEAAFVSVGK